METPDAGDWLICEKRREPGHIVVEGSPAPHLRPLITRVHVQLYDVARACRLILRRPRRKLDHELRVLVEQADRTRLHDAGKVARLQRSARRPRRLRQRRTGNDRQRQAPRSRPAASGTTQTRRYSWRSSQTCSPARQQTRRSRIHGQSWWLRCCAIRCWPACRPDQ